MKSNTIIAKIGGKILENNNNLKSTLNQFKQLLFEQDLIKKIILIPGGGSYANFVRSLDKRLNFGVDIAHWSAIYAMNYNGLYICKKFPDIQCINDYHELKMLLRDKKSELFCLFLPYDFLLEDDYLPHSWDITSDSITLYLAYKLGLDTCYLIKDIDGIYIKDQDQAIKEISALEIDNLRKLSKLSEISNNNEQLKKSKPIDTYLTTLIERFETSCVIINGTKSNTRILDYFNASKNEKDKIYTKIIHG